MRYSHILRNAAIRDLEEWRKVALSVSGPTGFLSKEGTDPVLYLGWGKRGVGL